MQSGRENSVHTFFGAIGAAGQGYDQRFADGAHHAAAQHGVWCALLTVISDGFFHAGNASVEHRLEGFGCYIAARKSGAASKNDEVTIVCPIKLYRVLNLVFFVRNDGVFNLSTL